MSGNLPSNEPMSEVARRAIALLSAAHQDLDIIDDDDVIWEMLGDTREQKIGTVLALAGVALGVAAIVGDPGEMLRDYGSRVDDLDKGE